MRLRFYMDSLRRKAKHRRMSFVIPSNAAEAIAIQQSLRHKVRLVNAFGPLDLIAGIDVSYDIVTERSFAFVVLMRIDDLIPLSVTRAILPTRFPYIPGLLSFREIPVILKALERLPQTPDMVMVDGLGIAHPRRLGIAAHLGALTDLPAIGVAKSKLCGEFGPLAEERGARVALIHRGERIGTVLRSKERASPLFISPGHRVDQETALAITLRCLKRHRLPEPTRIADKISKTGKYVSAQGVLF